MRICFVSFFYPTFLVNNQPLTHTSGGAGKYAKNICAELAKLGHEVHVLAPCTAKSKEKSIGDVIVHKTSILNLPFLRYPSYQFELIKRYKVLEKEVGKFDVLHGNVHSDFSLSSGLIKRPRVVTVHHLTYITTQMVNPTFLERLRNLRGEIGFFTPTIERIVIDRANKIIAISKATKQYLKTIYNVKEENVKVIYNGIHIEDYVFPSETIEEVRKQFGVEEGEKIILCVPGRINDPRKDIEILLKALPNVVSKVSAKCIIVGAGNPMTFEKHLVPTIRHNVVFTGFIDELLLRKFYVACDVFVLPSLLEGFPMAILEAMAAGKPIVATKVGGIPELINDQQHRFLVRKGDFLKLSEMLIYLLEHKKESQLLGRRNRERVKELFSWEKMAHKTVQVYDSLLGLN